LLADSSEAMRSLDVVVHASTAPEPFGLSIAEAMACGRAVVISEAGGALEVGDPERSCLAAPPGDVLALTRQIGRLLDDKGLRERLGREAAAEVRERFTHRKMGDALGAAYRSIAGRTTESARA
jgi:glycosyltransferase involved in cell wall biosynthesis